MHRGSEAEEQQMDANELLESTRRVAEAISADPKANVRAKLLAERFRKLDVALSTGENLPDEWDWEPGQVTHEEVVLAAQPVGTVAPIEPLSMWDVCECNHARTYHRSIMESACTLGACPCGGFKASR
jgi:hypothetical protein